MCYYCETQLPRRDTKGRIIPKHASINCKNWKNRASPNFKGHISMRLPNKWCDNCRKKTFHTLHANNGYEQLVLYCTACR